MAANSFEWLQPVESRRSSDRGQAPRDTNLAAEKVSPQWIIQGLWNMLQAPADCWGFPIVNAFNLVFRECVLPVMSHSDDDEAEQTVLRCRRASVEFDCLETCIDDTWQFRFLNSRSLGIRPYRMRYTNSKKKEKSARQAVASCHDRLCTVSPDEQIAKNNYGNFELVQLTSSSQLGNTFCLQRFKADLGLALASRDINFRLLQKMTAFVN